jgi:voltage-gated potassium channel
MAYIPSVANDPSSSPAAFGIEDIQRLIPFALALFDDRGPSSDYAKAKQGLRDWAKEDPIDALAAVVIGGGLAFYMAEKDSNPGCNSPLDGILYMSTALSVGYDNLFPTTPAGHALATFAQTFGPSLAANALEEPASVKRAREQEAAEVNRQILARLEDIVKLLEKQT